MNPFVLVTFVTLQIIIKEVPVEIDKVLALNFTYIGGVGYRKCLALSSVHYHNSNIFVVDEDEHELQIYFKL